MSRLNRLAAQLSGAVTDDHWRRRVTVTAFTTSPNTVTVQFSDGTTVAGVRYLNSYTPAVNDVVEAWQDGSYLFVLGVLA